MIGSRGTANPLKECLIYCVSALFSKAHPSPYCCVVLMDPRMHMIQSI